MEVVGDNRTLPNSLFSTMRTFKSADAVVAASVAAVRAITIAENLTAVVTLRANETVAWSLVGGEDQRIKLADGLRRRGPGKTLYILGGHTNGLHFEDVKKLLH